MWWVVTLFAAAFQTSRTAMQHRLRALLSVSGAGFVRYVYGAPIAGSAVAVAALAGFDFPGIGRGFWPKIAVAGLAQIVATVFLIRAFDARDFATGTVFSKTEVVQVAIFSLVFLGEPLSPGGYVSVAVCLLGIVMLVTKGKRLSRDVFRDGAARYGLIAGALFGLAAVGIRAATKEMTGASSVVKAIVSLAVMNTIQTILHGGYLVVREPGQVRLALTHWRSSAIVGVLSVCGSGCWSLAFVLKNAARVRTFGQVELLFTFAVSHLVFKERHVRAEYLASALVLVGVVGVVLTG